MRRKASQNLPASAIERAAAHARAEQRLMIRVFERCQFIITSSCINSSVPTAFLGALTANESAGDPKATRFEPSVYRHLKAVAAGQSPAYGGIHAEDLADEVQEMLHPKAENFHTRYLTEPFAANHREALAAQEDEALRELATSWGFTQIMGYHSVGRAASVRALLEPVYHFRTALEMLAEFAEDFQLDLAHEYEEMFRCWNTGAPYGETFDPRYVEDGLRRMELYDALSEASHELWGH
jgi:hypothetical protein